MIWHIFRKDWKLLWRLVLALAATRSLEALLLYKIDEGVPNLHQLWNVLQVMSVLGAVVLTAAVVHLDAIPGVRQDWLVRPIARKDLLAAKLLFVILLVAGPLVVIDWIGAMGHGFPFGPSLAAALMHAAMQLFVFYLPMFGFASLTRNFTEAVVGGAISAAVFAAMVQLAGTVVNMRAHLVAGTGANWLVDTTQAAIMLCGVAVVVALQYFRRKTVRTRGIAVAFGVLVALFSVLVPWRPVFAIQQRLAPQPGAGSPINLSFEPGQGRFQPPSGVYRDRGEGIAVAVPIAVSGLPDHSIILSSWVTARITVDRGTVDLGRAGNLVCGSKDSCRGYAHILVSEGTYAKLGQSNVQLDLDYSLTLMGMSDEHSIPARSESQPVPGMGRCASRLNPVGTALHVRCMEAGLAPSCVSYVLTNPSTQMTNPMAVRCEPTYVPFFVQLEPDALQRYGAGLPFNDPTGLANYPVNGPQLKQSRVTMQVFRAKDHFTRHLVIPEIRLSDWLSRQE